MTKENRFDLEETEPVYLVLAGAFATLVLLGAGFAVFTLADDLSSGGNQDFSNFNYPDGATPSGFDTNGTIVETHDNILQQRSYTLEAESGTSASNETVSFTYTYDNETEIALRQQTIDGNRTEVVEDFANGEVLSANALDTENTTYQRQTLNQSISYTGFTALSGAVQTANYTVTDVVERSDGTRVAVYESQGLTQVGSQRYSSVDAELQLTESGYFELISLSVTVTPPQGGDSITQTQQIQISDVGSTTVEEPTWLEEARSQPLDDGGDTGDGNSTDDGN